MEGPPSALRQTKDETAQSLFQEGTKHVIECIGNKYKCNYHLARCYAFSSGLFIYNSSQKFEYLRIPMTDANHKGFSPDGPVTVLLRIKTTNFHNDSDSEST